MSEREGYVPPEAHTELRDAYSGAPQALVDVFARVNTAFPQALTDIPMTIEMLATVADNQEIDVAHLLDGNLTDEQCTQLLDQLRQAHAAFDIDVGMTQEEEEFIKGRIRDAWVVFMTRVQAYTLELYESTPAFKRMGKDVTHDDTLDALKVTAKKDAFFASDEPRAFLVEIRDVLHMLQDILASPEIKKYAADYRAQLAAGVSVREATGNPEELRDIILAQLQEKLAAIYPDQTFTLADLSGFVQYVPPRSV